MPQKLLPHGIPFRADLVSPTIYLQHLQVWQPRIKCQRRNTTSSYSPVTSHSPAPTKIFLEMTIWPLPRPSEEPPVDTTDMECGAALESSDRCGCSATIYKSPQILWTKLQRSNHFYRVYPVFYRVYPVLERWGIYTKITTSTILYTKIFTFFGIY